MHGSVCIVLLLQVQFIVTRCIYINIAPIKCDIIRSGNRSTWIK